MAGPGGAPGVGRGSIFSDLGPRLSSAAVLLVLTILAVWLNGIWFSLFIGLVFAGFYREWEMMITGQSLGWSGIVLTGIASLTALAATIGGSGPEGFGGTALIVVAGIGLTLLTAPRLIAWRLAGLAYVGVVVLALVGLRGTDGWGLVACVYLGATVWMTDTGAFFAGRHFGGAKLNPEISPAKTWSGAIGGLASGALAGVVVWLIAGLENWWIGLAISICVSIAGQTGDLTESWVKRRFRVKDSGDIIPGHGGIMDRLDSLTFGAILMFLIGGLHAGWGNVARGVLIW